MSRMRSVSDGCAALLKIRLYSSYPIMCVPVAWVAALEASTLTCVLAISCLVVVSIGALDWSTEGMPNGFSANWTEESDR